MARFPHQFSAQDQQGKTVVGATVTISLTETDTPANIYEVQTGGDLIANSQITTDGNGYVKFWIDETDYTPLQYFRITIAGNSFKTTVLDDVVVFPATDTSQDAIDAAASAAAALVSENNAAADEVLTNADAIATAADVVSTNADVVLTGLDVVDTNADAVSTGDDATATAADVVSTNADVVSTGDDVTATNADVVSTNADVVTVTAQVGAVALKYTFSDTTAMADPGTGLVRLNHATIGSVTAIAFDDLSADSGNPDVSTLLLSLDDSTNTAHRGTITIKKSGAPATFITYSITGATTDNAGWSEFAVTYVDSNGTLTDADTLYFAFARTGNVGGGGTMSNLVEDTTPQLGGDLDLNGKNIDFPTTSDISDCLDEDDMVSNSATMLATQQSIKAYTDAARGVHNLVINGDMRISQRKTSFAGLIASQYTLDCMEWIDTGTTAGVVTITQDTDVPTVAEAGFRFMNSLKVDVTTAETLASADAALYLTHKIEAQNVTFFGHGATGALSAALQFWFKSTKTGIFTVNVDRDDATEKYSTEFTVGTTNTWEKHTVIIPGDTSGTVIAQDNGIGLAIQIMMAIGSAGTTSTANAWNASGTTELATSNQVNLLDNTANNVLITGIQYEVGGVVSGFAGRHISDELARTQRYYQKSYSYDVDPGTITELGFRGNRDNGFTSVDHLRLIAEVFAVPMRSAPSVTSYSNVTGTVGKVRMTSGDVVGTMDTISTSAFRAQGTNGAATTDHKIEFQYTAESKL